MRFAEKLSGGQELAYGQKCVSSALAETGETQSNIQTNPSVLEAEREPESFRN